MIVAVCLRTEEEEGGGGDDTLILLPPSRRRRRRPALITRQRSEDRVPGKESEERKRVAVDLVGIMEWESCGEKYWTDKLISQKTQVL
jgi:hypothetical protein